MHLPPLSSTSAALPTESSMMNPRDAALFQTGTTEAAQKNTKLGEASRQFEGVLVRQFLGESLKSLLENGSSGQVYGFYLNETISDAITKGGGLGLATVFQAQIAGQKGAQ